jgi:hypothetical protein
MNIPNPEPAMKLVAYKTPLIGWRIMKSLAAKLMLIENPTISIKSRNQIANPTERESNVDHTSA